MLWLTRSLYVTGWRPIAFLWIMELCLEKEGKALMLFYFMRQFFTSHEKNTPLFMSAERFLTPSFFLGTWEIKIDSLLFCASIERLFTLLSKGMQLMMPLFCLPKSQHFPLEIQLLCLSIRDASERGEHTLFFDCEVSLSGQSKAPGLHFLSFFAAFLYQLGKVRWNRIFKRQKKLDTEENLLFQMQQKFEVFQHE